MNNKEAIRLIKEIEPILYGSYKEAVNHVIKMVEIKPKTKTCKYIPCEDDPNFYECSNCGTIEIWNGYNYCPCCGAKLGGRQ